MRLRALVLLLVVLVGLLPTGGAVPLSVSTTAFTVGSVPDPVSGSYEFSFTDPPFDGTIGGNDSIHRAAVEMALDWGHLSKASSSRRAEMTFNFSSDNGSVEVRVVTSSERTFGGYWWIRTEAYLPGESVAYWSDRWGALHPWAGLDYESSSILAYAENEAAPKYRSDVDLQAEVSYWRPGPAIEGGAVYLVRHGDGSKVFGTRDVALFHVADLDGLTGVSVTVDYLEGLPDLLEVKSRFLTSASLAAFDAGDDCTGFVKWINAVLGFCPTLEGFVGMIAGGVSGVLAIVLAPIPGGASIATLAGQLSGEIAALYLSVLALVVVAPARLVVVVGGHIVAFSLLGAAYSRNLRDVPEGIKGGFRLLGGFFALYFLGWFWAIRWVYQFLATSLQTVVQAIRG